MDLVSISAESMSTGSEIASTSPSSEPREMVASPPLMFSPPTPPLLMRPISPLLPVESLTYTEETVATLPILHARAPRGALSRVHKSLGVKFIQFHTVDEATKAETTMQSVRSLYGLSECSCISRPLRALMTEKFTSEIAKISPDRIKPLNIASIGSGLLLQELFLVYSLYQAGYRNIHLQVIDNFYSPENMGEIEDKITTIEELFEDLDLDLTISPKASITKVDIAGLNALFAVDFFDLSHDFWNKRDLSILPGNLHTFIAKKNHSTSGPLTSLLSLK